MPPSAHPQRVESVLPGTMAADAPQDADGTIGASSAMDCTEGTNAHNSLPHQGIERWEDFNPLPLRVESPINVDILEHFLMPYPCPGTRDYLLRGFRHGFDIGFRGPFNEVDSRPRNLRSARSNPEGVTEAIAKELRRGHTSGPFPFPPFTHTHCSPVGAAPKPDGSVRLILDLSSPRGDSVNDGISKEDFTCKYSKFDDATSIILHTWGRQISNTLSEYVQ